MNLYESIFVLSNNLTQKLAEEKIVFYENLIKKAGGKTLKKEYWGVKNLAYQIKNSFKAHYFLLNFETTYNSILEIENKLKIDEDSLRFLNLRLKKFSKEPSIMLKKYKDEQ